MIEIKIINDLEKAKEVWEKLTPQELFYDVWDVRYCFYKLSVCPLYFYTAYDGDEPVALLPLQYNEKKNYLEFLAEELIEDNRPFFKKGYEYLIKDFLAIDFPHPLKIFDLMGEEEIITSLPLEDYVYFIKLEGLKDFNDYLTRDFTNRHRRHSFKSIFKNFEKNHKVEIVYDNFNDLNTLFELNVLSFEKESYLKTEIERQGFLDLVKLPLNWKMITVIVDGVKLAVSLSVVYNGAYLFLISGADVSTIKEAYKYLTKINLELAIKEKAKIFNLSLGDCNWKLHWHPDKSPRYKLEKVD